MVGRTEKWITTLMSGLEKNVDEKTLARILEQCGRQCQSQSFVKKAKGLYEKSKDIDDFLEKFGRAYKHLRREGEEVYIVYPRCFCSQVNKIPKGKLSGTYCNCSRGWAKEMFETVTGKPCEVELLSSIKRGAKECILVVRT